MVSDNSIRKLVTILEPRVWDLNDQWKLLSNKKDELENVSRFVAYTKDNYEMVGIYSDQDLVTSKFDELDLDVDDYKASCYLLKSSDENVKRLPQYEKALDMIKEIINYFIQYKATLQEEIQDMNIMCQKKEIEKKYYDILSSSNPYIENIKEFREIIDEHILNDKDKINILVQILKNNISNYESGNK